MTEGSGIHLRPLDFQILTILKELGGSGRFGDIYPKIERPSPLKYTPLSISSRTHKLKQKGLLEKSGGARDAVWYLTSKGEKALEEREK